MTKAGKPNKITTKKVVVEEALPLSAIIKNQKKFRKLWGKVKVDDLALE